MGTETAVLHPTKELTSDERWSAWIAKGRAHDLRVRKRARAALMAIAAAVALWLLSVLVRG